MIELASRHLAAIEAAAEAAYPEECCGLLVGTRGTTLRRVARVVPSANVAEGDRRRRFEVDPRLLLELQRTLRGSGREVVGLYHSHPDAPPRPSGTDTERAWQPELVWLITAVAGGRAGETTAHVLEPGERGFREVALRLTD